MSLKNYMLSALTLSLTFAGSLISIPANAIPWGYCSVRGEEYQSCTDEMVEARLNGRDGLLITYTLNDGTIIKRFIDSHANYIKDNNGIWRLVRMSCDYDYTGGFKSYQNFDIGDQRYLVVTSECGD